MLGVTSGLTTSMPTGYILQHEQQREQDPGDRLRRAAQRRGLALMKSRRRDPRAFDYGTYMLIDQQTNFVVASGSQSRQGRPGEMGPFQGRWTLSGWQARRQHRHPQRPNPQLDVCRPQAVLGPSTTQAESCVHGQDRDEQLPVRSAQARYGRLPHPDAGAGAGFC